MTSSLYLFPKSPAIKVTDSTLILDTLTQLDMLSAAFNKQRFLLNDGFFQYVIFAGCSPNIKLEPASKNDLDFCHLSVLGPFTSPALLMSSTQARPRCTNCKKTIHGWKEAIPAWTQNPDSIVLCQHCQHQNHAITLNWKKYAAIGQFMLQFHHIYPGEAMPSDQLLEQLAKATKFDWQFAWADSS